MKAMNIFYFAVFVAFLLGTSGRGIADEDICVLSVVRIFGTGSGLK
jgi:hypothetical protein